jgi:hypothetical protein
MLINFAVLRGGRHTSLLPAPREQSTNKYLTIPFGTFTLWMGDAGLARVMGPQYAVLETEASSEKVRNATI